MIGSGLGTEGVPAGRTPSERDAMRIKTSKKSITDQAAELVEQVGPHVDAARERIVNDYLPVAQTILSEARDTARDRAQDAMGAAQAAAADAEKSTRKRRRRAAKQARSKAGEWATATAVAAPLAAPLADRVAAKVDPKPKRRKRVVLLLALLGAGAVVFKKMRAGDSAGAYAPSAAPRPAPRAVPDPGLSSTPPPAPPAQHFEPDPDAPVTDTTTDQGGAFLDEVAADADEEPHPVTTPDQPAEVEDVGGARHSRKA
jgi:hypothetical protein